MSRTPVLRSLKEEKKAEASFMKSVGLLVDTIKTDVFGGIIKDIETYKTRATR